MSVSQAEPTGVRHLISRRLLARNTIINLLGQAFPIIFGLVTIPFIVKGFGTDRFGLLTLAWAVVGYFSLFDLGLGRAITQLVAEKLGKSETQDIPGLVWTGLAVMSFFGLGGAVLAAAISPTLAYRVLKIPISLREEAMWSFFMLSLSLPLVIVNAGLVGLLTAFQRFALINALRVPSSASTNLVTIGVMLFSKSLVAVCASLVFTRALFLALYLTACFHAFPPLRGIRFDRTQVRQLLRFGGWMTITNVLGPLMVYMDRFVIGAFLSTTAVTFYATPYEAVTKLWFIAGAIVSSLFPAFATAKSADISRASELYSMGGRIVLVLLTPVILGLVVFASDGLKLWLGADFAAHSTLVLQCLAVGVYLNSFAQIPFALIQGLGRPELTAKLHALELPFYAFAMVWLLGRFGIVGVALAWLIRVAVDCFLLAILAQRLVPDLSKTYSQIIPALVAPLIFFLLGASLQGLAIKACFYFMATACWAVLVYFRSTSILERQSFIAGARSFLK
jgi:O-antigen/teichoic acid export membrane protein